MWSFNVVFGNYFFCLRTWVISYSSHLTLQWLKNPRFVPQQIDDVSKPNKDAVTLSTDCDVQFDAVVTIAPR